MDHPHGTSINIPFNKPYLTGKESAYLAQAFRNMQFSGNGDFTRQCSLLIEDLLKCPRAFLTTSCTHALEMAALLLDIRPGDEVIVPSFTFASTVNAFVLRGAKPVFIDVRQDTFNFDERMFAPLISERTRAAVPVHYAGVGCEMDSILETALKHGVEVVEDNAHGFSGQYKRRYLGTFGCLAAQSFHETKNLSCGEGGALLINRQQLIERAEIIREKGTNRSRFFRGEVDRYTWVSVGSSYALSDILAAFLLAQLEERQGIQERRRSIWEYYSENLKDLPARYGVGLPHVPAHCSQSFHMFYIMTRGLEERTRLIAHLKSKGILAVFHYVPLHLSQMGMRLGGRRGQCPVTEDISERLLRLPFYNELIRQEQDQVIEEVRVFYRHAAESDGPPK